LADERDVVAANPFRALLILAIRAMRESKTFMLRREWPFPKLTPLMGFWQLQLFLLGVALAISGMYWLLRGNTNPTQLFLFTFIIGNLTWLAVTLSAPVLLNLRPLLGLVCISGRSSPGCSSSEFDVNDRKPARRGPDRPPTPA